MESIVKDNEDINLKLDTDKMIKIIMECSAITTVFFGVLLKFISMGRTWCFQFDFDTFPLDINNEMLFLLFYFILCSVVGSSIFIICYKCLSLVKNFIEKSTFYEILSIVLTEVIIFIGSILLKIIFDSNIIFLCTLFLSGFSSILCYLFVPLISKIKNTNQILICVIVLLIIVSIFFSAFLFHQNYINAKEQKEFGIVEMNNSYYAIINENNEKYSMYQCYLNENEIIIYSNKNLIIDKNNAVYDLYSFDKVSFQKYIFKYNGEKKCYEGTSENYELIE